MCFGHLIATTGENELELVGPFVACPFQKGLTCCQFYGLDQGICSLTIKIPLLF